MDLPISFWIVVCLIVAAIVGILYYLMSDPDKKSRSSSRSGSFFDNFPDIDFD